MAIGGGPIRELGDLRAPMSQILGGISDQLEELKRYKMEFGKLDKPAMKVTAVEDAYSGSPEGSESLEGSDTEQE